MGRTATLRPTKRSAQAGLVRRGATLAVLAAMVVGTGGLRAAGAATSPTPLTPVNLTVLEQSFRATQTALAQRHAAELARLEQHWADKKTQRQQAAASEQAQIRAGSDAAAAPVVADGQAQIAAVDALGSDFFAAYDTKKAVKQAWVAQHENDLAPGSVPLTGSAATAAKAPLDAQLVTDKAAVDTQTKATTDALTAQRTAAAAQAKLDRSALQAQQSAALTALKNLYAELTAKAQQDGAARLADLVAEAAELKTTYDQTVANINAQKARDVAAATAAGTSTSELLTQYKASLTEQSSLYSILVNQNKTAQSAAKAATSANVSALSAALKAEQTREAAANKTALALFDANTAAADFLLWEQIAVAGLRAGELKADLDAIYAVNAAVAVRDSTKFTNALAAVVPLVDQQRSSITNKANEVLGKQEDLAQGRTNLRLTQVRAPFDQQLDKSASDLASDLTATEANRQADKSKVITRQQREDLLAKTNYLIMRTRAAAYLVSADAGLVALDNAYDPATDPGSLYNVAKTIGAGKGADPPTGNGVKVALLDTGVVPVDGLAQSNVTIGPDFSFEDLSDDLRGLDTNGHGTHLGGIIAGTDDQWLTGDHSRTSSRFLGIAPDVQLVALKAATADGTTDVSQVIAGINWVIAYNQQNPTARIRALNLSYGTDSEQDYTVDPLTYAVERAWKAGIVVVVSAGNDGWDASHLTNPARDPYVIAVGASQSVGDATVAADYSSEGAQDRGVDLVAPGRSVVSLRNPGGFADQFNGGGRAGDRFVRGSGTSQAAAVVTGAVALLLQQRPELTPDQVKTLLEATATPVTAGDPALNGSGLLNIDKALHTSTIYTFPQAWTPATGTGSLEAARGTSHVTLDDGTPLVGEQDVLGNDFSSDHWATDAWTGRSWRAGGWSGRSWRADSWTGRSWRDADWDGRSWRGDGWDGRSWRDADWTGRSWRADRWAGRSWRDDNWDGRSWRSDGWEGRSWRGFGSF